MDRWPRIEAAHLPPSNFIGEKVGDGGQARIFRFHPAKQRETWAIKVFRKPDDADLELASQVPEHRHILKPDPVILDDGRRKRPAQMMAMASGSVHDIKRSPYIHDKRFKASETADILAQASLGLHHAQQTTGLSHNDVKPANLMIVKDTIKVGDWDGATRPGGAMRVFTPSYVDPHVFTSPGNKPNSKSDVYSLGATAHEMMTTHSFHAFPEDDTIQRQFAEASRNGRNLPTERNSQIKDPYMARVIGYATHMDLEKRSSHMDLQADLAAYPEAMQWFSAEHRDALAAHIADRTARVRERDPFLNAVPAYALLTRGELGPQKREQMEDVISTLGVTPDELEKHTPVAHADLVAMSLDSIPRSDAPTSSVPPKAAHQSRRPPARGPSL